MLLTEPSGAGPASRRLRDELPGRRNELATLRVALDRARNGRAQVVLVESEPGTGKSALLEAFLDGHDPADVVSLSCDEFEADLAFGAVGVLLGRTAPIQSDVEAGRRLLARLSDAQHEPHHVRVLAIDDAQWLDRSSLRALRFALRRLREERFLAVIARRPTAADSDGGLADIATAAVRLGSLDVDAVRQLARNLRSWDLRAEVAERLVQRTGGLPLLLVAVLRDAASVRQLAVGAEIPATAAAAAARLLSAVPDQSKLLVEASAVLAQPTGLVGLNQLARVEDPHGAVGPAVSAGLLTLTSSSVVDCAHDLLREAVYQAISPARRQELHARAAEWTVGDRRLAHRAVAASLPDTALAAELVCAADTARTGLRYGLAASQRLRARSLTGDADQRDTQLLEALFDRVSAQDLSGAALLADSAEQLPGSALRCLALGVLARDSGRIGAARTLLDEALTRARADGDALMAERAGIAAGLLYVRIGENRAAIEAIGRADRSADTDVAGDARTIKGIGLWQSGDPAGALALLDHAQLSQDGTVWEPDLLAVRAAVRMYSGQLSQALADLDRAVGQAHLWRPSPNQSRIYAMRSSARFWLGDWDGAAVDATAARALAEGDTEGWTLPIACAVSVDVPAGRGQWATAGEHLTVAAAAAERMPWIQSADAVAARRADLLLARHDYAAVLTLLRPLRGEDHLAPMAPFRSHRWLQPAWILACLGLGRDADAERSIAVYLEMIDRWPGGPTPSRLGWLRGLLAETRGDTRAARDHYAQDLQDPALRQTPYEHGQVLLAAGRLERSLGARLTAVGHLRDAQSLFAGLRAQPHLQRCVAELNACGLQLTAAGPSGLSEREEDVATLIARGYTNKEVAAELFVTVKAVEYHLSKIYSKLGVSNRRELRRLRA